MGILADLHPELFHYTGVAGVEGILKNQTLWATHARSLNDASELIAFRERLPRIIRPEIAGGVAELVRLAPANQTIVDSHGGFEHTVDEVNTGIVNAIFVSLFGAKDVPAFADPYVVSFCTGSGEVADHGLLSQWRGYGRQGGYAIVFDTAKLDKLLAEEKSLWHLDLFGGDVVYSDATDDQVRAEIGTELDVIKRSIAAWLTTGGRDEQLEEVYYPLIWCACRYKHWGFHEEREVRIVAIPPNADILAELLARGSAVKPKPLHHFTKGKRLVPTVHLFESITRIPDRPLPIRRIIVGPGDDAEGRELALRILIRELNLDVPVTVSAIPYVERSDD